MIRTLIFLGLWAASPTLGQVGNTALYTEFEHKPAPALVQALKEEVDALMVPNGLRLEWKSLPADGQSVWMELAVVKFSGRCEVFPYPFNPHLDRRLGWTHMDDGVVLPFAEVDCDAIIAYITKDLFDLPPKSRDKVLGRAIGRVAAHELLHIFARTAEHNSNGVGQPTLSVAELLADRMVFDELDPDVHIVRTNPAYVPRTGPGSPQAGQVSFLRNGCATCHGSQGEGTRHGPTLRGVGHFLNPVVLAAKLTHSQSKMFQRARELKIATPSVAEDEIVDLVSFLNGMGD